VTAEERAVAAVLRRISAEAPPVHIPDNLWARGRRRRRLRMVAEATGIAALVAMTALPVAWAPRWQRAAPAEDERSIPSEVLAPMPLQPNLVDAPNGPASVIITGPGGFGANDVFGYDDRAVVVGRDGLYRYVRELNSFDAGEDLLLSPDGRYVAGGAGLEGVEWGESASDWQSAAGVMDLATGEVRSYHDGPPVAWSPDGRLLTAASSGELALLDLNSGEAVPLGVAGAEAVAFSPDGHQLALQVDRELTVLNVDTRAVRGVAELSATQTLAGPGAWSAGGRLAVWDRTDCLPACPAGYLDLRLSFVDINDGSSAEASFDAMQTVSAMSATLLGWQSDGDAVVVLALTRLDPAGPQVAAPQIVALHPGGGQASLIAVTGEANRIDVARDLLDHFGGESRSGWELFVDTVRVRVGSVVVPIATIAALVIALLAYRRLRRRPGGGTAQTGP
jgi:hypothetical protein